MSSKNKYYEVMALIGCGYSVQTIIEKAGISYDELCEVCAEHTDLEIELKKWFPKYDFTVKAVKQTESDEIKEEKEDGKVSSGKQSVKGKAKGKSK